MNRNCSRFHRTARMAAPAMGALALTLVFAGPASADPAFVTVSSGEVRFFALPGEENTVTFAEDGGGNLFVGDATSTILAGPGCTQSNPHVVTCGAASAVTRIRAVLGDGDDFVSNETSIRTDIDGGFGDDELFGGEGPDRITDPDGSNVVHILPTIGGRGGNDTIISRNGRFDTIDCGPGAFDILLADPVDTVSGGCEVVRRF
ncbi:hypothetical protein ACGFYU_08205 [Streptomyces sp. NPDC048337]|uniref:hypothetical protein n=1 Tax=Streptomyces sp. NPDC048337 TaxID=3365535 RepID=UPI003722F2D7